MTGTSGMTGMTGNPFADIPGSGEPYPAWSADRQIPMSTEEIEDIFLDLAQKFGFQKDSMRNMVRVLSMDGGLTPHPCIALLVPDVHLRPRAERAVDSSIS